ncbi:hypothetical protein EIP91_010605 [Steccherinum ochraceum]|uniref:Uncharacterized protein n=1 Tax=Steccherinum ochraceum TaxID=92696 RepID=A0A4R0R0F0_9APHY|nr:hypothetical protein EIP91_010605 [Steccherinum ochraceum]
MSSSNIDEICDLWKASLLQYGGRSPRQDHKDLYNAIDRIASGGVGWDSFTLNYDEDRPECDAPSWMDDEHEIWFRDPKEIVEEMLANPDYSEEIDFAPLRDYDGEGQRRYQNLLSGQWAWDQADIIVKDDPTITDASFVPVILGSDKTTVSVAWTGQTDYYPLYLSVGNVHNEVRRAHRNAVAVIGFLAIPNFTKQNQNDIYYRKWRRKLYHASIARILQPLRAGMTTPVLTRCGDGFYRKVIYGLGPYIADYPEQVLLASVVQRWCANHLPITFHAQISISFLLQIYSIKLSREPLRITLWSCLLAEDAEEVLDDIDRRIALAPPFTGLRRFPQGRGFKQWTGDDSKALMKVYLPAILGYVPDDMVQALRAFLEFCYLVRRNVFTAETFSQMEETLEHYYKYREIFQKSGACPKGYELPRQHSLKHYLWLTILFGAPNGLCSSITESKHIAAVKEPWRRTNRFKALVQMLIINTRKDKLAAARTDFEARGMLDGGVPFQLDEQQHLPAAVAHVRETIAAVNQEHKRAEALRLRLQLQQQSAQSAEQDNREESPEAFEGPPDRGRVDMAVETQSCYPSTVEGLAEYLDDPSFPSLVHDFLTGYLDKSLTLDPDEVDDDEVKGSLAYVHHSAAATYFAPSDACGTGGMHREHLRVTRSWWKGPARYDCALVRADDDAEVHLTAGGFTVVRIKLLFSLKRAAKRYPCALVHWFSRTFHATEQVTGLYSVAPQYYDSGDPFLEVIPISSIYRAAHSIPVYSEDHLLPHTLSFDQTLDSFSHFFINKFADHHMFATIPGFDLGVCSREGRGIPEGLVVGGEENSNCEGGGLGGGNREEDEEAEAG